MPRSISEVVAQLIREAHEGIRDLLLGLDFAYAHASIAPKTGGSDQHHIPGKIINMKSNGSRRVGATVLVLALT